MILRLPVVPVLFGPTASGKSALALQVAERLSKPLIINADSRQLYRGFPILNACPSAADYAAVPHALYEVLDPRTRFSAAEYAKMSLKVIEKAIKEDFQPVVVGGTGFYLRALMAGLSAIPASDPAVEAAVAAMPADRRFAALQAADPAIAAKLRPTDTQRVVRALTVFRQTGKPLSAWQTGAEAPNLPWRWLKVGLNPPRAAVHAALSQRWEVVNPALGVVAEAKALVAAGYTGEEPGLKGLAIPLWLAYARGEMDLATVTQKALEADRQYAKRQFTWLRNSFGADLMLENPAQAEAVNEILARI